MIKEEVDDDNKEKGDTRGQKDGKDGRK